MTIVACNLMKKSVISSAVFILVGSLLVLFTQLMSVQNVLGVVFFFTGFFTIFTGLFVLLLTGVLALLPAVRQRLELCQH